MSSTPLTLTQPYHGARAAHLLLPRLQVRRPPHGHPVRRSGRSVVFLQVVRKYQGPHHAPAVLHAHDRQGEGEKLGVWGLMRVPPPAAARPTLPAQPLPPNSSCTTPHLTHTHPLATPPTADADAGGICVQDARGPADRLPQKQPELRGTPAVHAVCAAVRTLQSGPGVCAGPGEAAGPAPGPRAECVDDDCAVGRVVPGQPVCLRGGGRVLPVGPRPRRGQRGRAQNAARHWHPRKHSGRCRARQGQGRCLSPHGLWPPRVQTV